MADSTVYDGLPTHLIDVEDIDVSDRIRQDVGGMRELEDLGESLHKIGQLHPIIIEDGNLRAGGRRYAATLILRNSDRSIGGLLDEDNPRRLPQGKILAILYDELDDIQRLLIEIEENRKRKDFNKAEEALAMRRLHEAMSDSLGRKATVGEMAEATKYSKSHITMGMKVAKAVEDEGREELLDSSSIFGAYQKLRALTKTEELKERSKNIKTTGTPVEDLFKVGDGIEWLESLDAESVDFVHFDPPWGIGIDKYDRRKKYDEWEDHQVKSWEDIIVPMVPELYRVMKDDTWMVCWFGVQYYQQMRELLESVGFKVYDVPSIWFKPNKKGSQNDPSKTELDVYEVFFKVAKGDPRLFKTGTNVFEYPMPSRGERIHFAQKNVDMLVDVLERYTFGKMRVIDPTAGSGAVFKAAIRLGRTFEGRDMNEDNVDKALDWLRVQDV